MYVPYTEMVLDLDDHGGWANGIKVQVYSDFGSEQAAQKWVIDSST